MRLILALLALLASLPSLPSLAAGPRPAATLAAIEKISREARLSNSDAVLIMQGDDVLLEQISAAGGGPIELMSVTKSVVALAIGALLQDRGLESLDTPVHTFFPEWKQGRKQQITVRMLMAHTSGLQDQARDTSIEVYPAPDVVQLALAAELTSDPGAQFAYNNKASNLLAGIIARAAGEPMDKYVQRKLLDPLGVRAAPWSKDASGTPYAMAGLSFSVRDAARIGRLVLDRGRLGERELVPPAFIDEMLAPSPGSAAAGLLWWRRSAWVRFRADDASFQLLEQVGAAPDLVEALRPLHGQHFDGADALYSALARQLGPAWRDRWHAELIAPHGVGPWRPFHPQEGPVEAFEANGWLGQSIIVVPKASLVAVRQVIARDDHKPNHDYVDFPAHVQALADALVPPVQSP